MLVLQDSGPKITTAEIARFEGTYRIRLPADYKGFLLQHNGGRPNMDLFPVPQCIPNPIARIHYFFGIGFPMACYDLSWNYEIFSDRIPSKFISIATTEGADQVCLCISGADYGLVVYWDGYTEVNKQVYSVAATFDVFCEMLFRDEHSPHIP